VYLFMRWAYARAGITSPSANISSSHQQYQAVGGQFTKQGAFPHSDSGDTANGSDHYLIESQLELADFPSGSGSGGGSSGGGARDVRSKGLHRM
jgi:hypothetical protein